MVSIVVLKWDSKGNLYDLSNITVNTYDLCVMSVWM